MADQTQLIPAADIAVQVKDRTTGKMGLKLTVPFQIFFRTLRKDINSTIRVTPSAPIQTTAKNASIATTDLLVPVPSVNSLYVFQFYGAVTTADGVSSSLIPILTWTDGTVVKQKTFATINGNTTTTTGSEDYMFRADAGAPVTYAVTYASNTPGVMVYNFYAVLSTVAGVS